MRHGCEKKGKEIYSSLWKSSLQSFSNSADEEKLSKNNKGIGTLAT